MHQRHTFALHAAASGALVATGITAFVALALIVARPVLVSSAILREALLQTLVAVALAGLAGGLLGGLVAPFPGAAGISVATLFELRQHETDAPRWRRAVGGVSQMGARFPP